MLRVSECFIWITHGMSGTFLLSKANCTQAASLRKLNCLVPVLCACTVRAGKAGTSANIRVQARGIRVKFELQRHHLQVRKSTFRGGGREKIGLNVTCGGVAGFIR